MIRFFISDSIETHDEFSDKVNAAIDEYRDAGLVVNYTPIPGGALTVYAQIGVDEPVPVQGGHAWRFKDLPKAEVLKRLEMRKSAIARGAGSVKVLGPRD